MSRAYAKISVSLWQSRKFKSLRNNDRARLLYCYFHTCRQVNSCGCFPCPIGYVIADLNWGESQIAEAIDSLCIARLIDWNPNEEVVRIIGFLEHDKPTNLKHGLAVIRVALELPDCKEKCATLNDLLKNEHCRGDDRLKGEFDRLSQAYPEAIDSDFPLTPSLVPIPVPNPTSLRSVGAGKPAPRRKMPEDWPSKDDQENAIAYWRKAGREDLIPRLQDEITKARAHYLGKGTRSPDWSQVWVTWYARALEYNRAPAKAASQFPTAKILSITGS